MTTFAEIQEGQFFGFLPQLGSLTPYRKVDEENYQSQTSGVRFGLQDLDIGVEQMFLVCIDSEAPLRSLPEEFDERNEPGIALNYEYTGFVNQEQLDSLRTRYSVDRITVISR